MKDYTLLDQAECRPLWEKAKKKIVEKNTDILEDSEAIHRLQTTGLNGQKKYCYKPELFVKKGWCILAKSSPGSTSIHDNKQKWGFCSTSCNIEFMKVTKYYIWNINVIAIIIVI